jgi:hypothetical protein
MAQQSAFPLLTKCKNPKCDNLVSNVAERTRAKEYCSIPCRDRYNNSKPRGVHKIQAEQLICIDCNLPKISNASTRGNQRKICVDCTNERTKARGREMYWRKKNV